MNDGGQTANRRLPQLIVDTRAESAADAADTEALSTIAWNQCSRSMEYSRILRRLPFGEERYQTPAESRPLALPIDRANHGHRLGGRNVEARRELPLVMHEIEFALD